MVPHGSGLCQWIGADAYSRSVGFDIGGAGPPERDAATDLHVARHQAVVVAEQQYLFRLGIIGHGSRGIGTPFRKACAGPKPTPPANENLVVHCDIIQTNIGLNPHKGRRYRNDMPQQCGGCRSKSSSSSRSVVVFLLLLLLLLLAFMFVTIQEWFHSGLVPKETSVWWIALPPLCGGRHCRERLALVVFAAVCHCRHGALQCLGHVPNDVSILFLRLGLLFLFLLFEVLVFGWGLWGVALHNDGGWWWLWNVIKVVCFECLAEKTDLSGFFVELTLGESGIVVRQINKFNGAHPTDLSPWLQCQDLVAVGDNGNHYTRWHLIHSVQTLHRYPSFFFFFLF